MKPITDPVEVALVAKYKDVLAAFEFELRNNWEEIDLGAELDLYAFSKGFFVAKGVTVDDLSLLACIVRYDLKYWDIFN